MMSGLQKSSALSLCSLSSRPKQRRVALSRNIQARQHIVASQPHAALNPWVSMIDRGRNCCLAAAVAGLILIGPGMAQASDKVASFPASGFVFKDTVNIIAVPDPDVEGVTIYVSDFQRSLTDKLAANDFFSEPSQASVTCSVTGKLIIPDLSRISNKEGAEVFAERKNVFNILQNKTLRVRRIYDPERRTLLYVAYATHSISSAEGPGRYRTSICAIPLEGSLGTSSQTGAAAQSGADHMLAPASN